MILLTDGVNNRGSVAPATAAELAKAFGIRVYTIGVGTYGEAPYPVPTPFGVQLQNMPVEIDEEVLEQIATLTGGKYFRATDNDKLKQIYSEIDQLEKSKIEVKHFSKKNEQYFIFCPCRDVPPDCRSAVEVHRVAEDSLIGREGEKEIVFENKNTLGYV